MKAIRFRPLRRIKKTGKITVASYTQWRTVKTADYSEFRLLVDSEYRQLPADEFVYDQKGQQLFWSDYDPASIPIFNYSPIGEVFDVTRIGENNPNHAINWNGGHGLHYCSSGMDCDGVPTFSHYSASYVAEHHFDNINDFEPLTVGVVVRWFGWFLYQLEKSRLQIGERVIE